MRTSLLAFLTLLCGCLTAHAQPTDEAIAPVVLRAGVSDTVLVADLFYAPAYPVTFGKHPDIQVAFDATNGTVVLTPRAEHEGLSVLPFTFDGEAFLLPLRTVGRQPHTFRYAPQTPAERVHLIGQFNDWSRTNTPLRDEEADGVFETTLMLEPGRYEYKFVVDGEERIDESNPEKVPNPFGAFNSVLTIAPRYTEQTRLHALQHRRLDSRITLSFLYGRDAQPEPLDVTHLIALLGNRRLPAEALTLEGNRIDIHLGENALKGNAVVRLAVTQDGLSTPMQTVYLHDGNPLGAPQTPFSWHDAVLYSIMTDRFADGDPINTQRVENADLLPPANYHGGDLQGILDQLDAGYFTDLGVNVLWLSPVNQNTRGAFREYPPPHRFYSGYHGYWPTDAYAVDTRFGDLALLKTLVDRAHTQGIRVMLDFVSNHVHQEHPFFQEHPDWFGEVDLPDGRKNIRLWDEQRLTTWFDTFLPSFDYLGSDEALGVMTDNAVWWIEQTGIDGFRHDAVKHIPNRFWRTQTRKITEQIDRPNNRRTFQIGETFGSYDLISSYVNPGQLDAQFNFNLYDAAQQVFLDPKASFARLDDEQRKTFSVYGPNHLMGNLMDSHDKVRYMAYTDGDLLLSSPDAAEIGWTNPPVVDDPQSYREAQLYLAWVMTIPGVPTVYYGDEIGMTGAADPDNRRPMRFDNELSDAERAMYASVRHLVHLRRRHPALRYGDFLTLAADTNVYAYLRSDMNERVLVLLNKSNAPQSLTIHLPPSYGITTATDAISDERMRVRDSQMTLEVPAVGWRVLTLE